MSLVPVGCPAPTPSHPPPLSRPHRPPTSGLWVLFLLDAPPPPQPPPTLPPLSRPPTSGLWNLVPVGCPVPTLSHPPPCRPCPTPTPPTSPPVVCKSCSCWMRAAPSAAPSAQRCPTTPAGRWYSRQRWCWRRSDRTGSSRCPRAPPAAAEITTATLRQTRQRSMATLQSPRQRCSKHGNAAWQRYSHHGNAAANTATQHGNATVNTATLRQTRQRSMASGNTTITMATLRQTRQRSMATLQSTRQRCGKHGNAAWQCYSHHGNAAANTATQHGKWQRYNHHGKAAATGQCCGNTATLHGNDNHQSPWQRCVNTATQHGNAKITTTTLCQHSNAAWQRYNHHDNAVLTQQRSMATLQSPWQRCVNTATQHGNATITMTMLCQHSNAA